MKKKIICGGVPIGGGSPVTIQSMTNTFTADVAATVKQCRQLTEAGCDIIRITVNTDEACEAFREIRKKIDAPLVADIHFDYTLALKSIKYGADKIRINPGNIGDRANVEAVVKAAKSRHIPIRVGVNSGSLEKDILAEYGKVTAAGLALSAQRNVKLLEDMDFEDIVVSLKASDVRLNSQAYRIAHGNLPYPLHVGVTEAGTVRGGMIKSAIGIGSLLMEGIGDTIRVSLTADPVQEVICAREILKSLGMAESSIDIRSCPTCGRTEVDLEKIAGEIETHLLAVEKKRKGKKSLKVAVMGCAVNGPGEAKEADIGVACGRGSGLLFLKGNVVKKVEEKDIIREITRMVQEYEDL